MPQVTRPSPPDGQPSPFYPPIARNYTIEKPDEKEEEDGIAARTLCASLSPTDPAPVGFRWSQSILVGPNLDVIMSDAIPNIPGTPLDVEHDGIPPNSSLDLHHVGPSIDNQIKRINNSLPVTYGKLLILSI